MRVINYIQMETEDFMAGKKPQHCRCITLDDVVGFSLTVKPTEEDIKLLAEEGFVQYEPDDIDGDYHFAREEYLV